MSTQACACPSCAWSDAQKRYAEQPHVRQRLRDLSAKAAAVTRKDPRFVAIRRRCEGAKNRCQCPTNQQYGNYGGRGIEFQFASALEMAEWVVANLGYPPEGWSLDRVNNSGHYAAGNLRWANDFMQGQNKRAYVRTATGERIARLQNLRRDVTSETLRTWIKKGMTDEQILTRRKNFGCGVRHR